MKNPAVNFVPYLFILIYNNCAIGQVSDAVNTTFIPLSSNGYVYPETDDSINNIIENGGLVNWDKKGFFSRTFFYPQQTGVITVGLKIKSLQDGCVLDISLDSLGKSY